MLEQVIIIIFLILNNNSFIIIYLLYLLYSQIYKSFVIPNFGILSDVDNLSSLVCFSATLLTISSTLKITIIMNVYLLCKKIVITQLFPLLHLNGNKYLYK